MTQRRWFLPIAGVALIVLASGAAFAQPGPPPGPGPGQGPQMGPPPQAPGLQLTDEQRTKLQALAKEERDRTHAARDEMQTLREQLQTELYADKPDEVKVKQLRADLTKAQQEMFAARLDRQQKLAQIFTAEQRKQLRDFRARRPFMMGPGGFGGPGVGWPRPGIGPGMGRFPGGLPGTGVRRGLRGWDAWGGPGMGGRGRWFRGRGLRGPLGPGPGYGPGWRWRDELGQ